MLETYSCLFMNTSFITSIACKNVITLHYLLLKYRWTRDNSGQIFWKGPLDVHHPTWPQDQLWGGNQAAQDLLQSGIENLQG